MITFVVVAYVLAMCLCVRYVCSYMDVYTCVEYVCVFSRGTCVYVCL